MIQEGIKHIGESAFSGFSWITSELVLPSTIESIGPGAFEGCSSIQGSIKFNSKHMKTISEKSFKGCSTLTSLFISSYITVIKESAFEGCTGLREIIYCGFTDPVSGSNQFKGTSTTLSVFSEYKGDTFCGISVSNYDANSKIYSNVNQRIKYTIVDKVLKIKSENNGKNVTMDNLRVFCSLNEKCISCGGYDKIEKVILEVGIEFINEESFSGCSSLVAVEFPDSLIKLGQCSFLNCNKLNCQLNFGTNLKIIGEQAFKGCSSLVGPVTITSNEFTTFGASAFEGLSKLSGVAIPTSLIQIGDNAFKGCSSLTNAIDLSHDAFTAIGASAFEGCSITDVKFGNNFESINDNAFRGCIHLNSILLMKGIKNILTSAFEGCTSIIEIYLPYTIKKIYPDAFKGCTCLRSITSCIEYNPSFNDQPSFSGIHDVKVIVPPNYDINLGFCGIDSSKLTKVSKAEIKDGISLNFVGSTLEISGSTDSPVTYDFVMPNIDSYNNPCLPTCSDKKESIKALIIHEGVKIIGDNAFKGLSWISNDINLPNSLISIGPGAFEGCSNIPKIEFKNGRVAVNIKSNTFKGCTKLVTVILPSTITEIGESAFESSGINNIDLPLTLINIKESAFKSCKELVSVTMNGLLNEKQTNLKEIKINSLKTIETNAFLNCTSLKDINFGLVLEKIGRSAFKDTKISSIVFPSTLKEIGESAFANSSIEEVKIPSSVTRILPKAFESNALLHLVEYCGINDPTVIDSSQFENCPNLKNASVPTTYKDQTFCVKSIDKSLKPEYCHVETMVFSFSEAFTISKSFAESSHFSNSFNFRSSHEFSQSAGFKATSAFIESSIFSRTTKFLRTDDFKNSRHFSYSNGFSKSVMFEKTSYFRETKRFLSTNELSNSNEFYNTKSFTQTDKFAASNLFTASQNFSSSQNFAETIDFSNSMSLETRRKYEESLTQNNWKVESSTEEISETETKNYGNALLKNVKESKTGVVVGAVVVIFIAIIIVLIIVYLMIHKKKKKENIDELNDTAEMETCYTTESLADSELWTEFNTITQDHTFFNADQQTEEIFKDTYEEIFLP